MARSAAGPPSTSAADAKAAEKEAAGGGARPTARAAAAHAADAAHSRGYMLRKQGNFLGAVEAYSEAIELQPAHFKALFNRAFSYDKVLAWLLWILVSSDARFITHNFASKAQAEDGVQLGQWAKAEEEYGKALRVAPKSSFALYNRGHAGTSCIVPLCPIRTPC